MRGTTFRQVQSRGGCQCRINRGGVGVVARTIACRGTFSCRCDAATRDNSCCTTCANSPIWRSISIIFSRMFRIISMPARFTPISRASVRITSSRSRSESVYSRVFPWERDGFSSPTRSYSRSVCGCSLYSSATALIMYPALARFFARGGIVGFLHSGLSEQILPRIRGRNAFQFLHQISHALVCRRRHDHLNLHVLIASRAVPCARHAFFLQPQRLSAVGSRRNSHDRPPVYGSRFNLCPQRRLAYRDRNLDVQIVAAPFKKLMRPHHHPQVQIARGGAHGPGIAFARNPHPPAIRNARRDAHVNRLRAPHAPFAAARLARGSQLARPTAPGARHVEAHFARGLLNRARSPAYRACLWRAYGTGAMAGLASIQSRDRKLFHRSAHGIPEIDLDLVFQVTAGFVLRLHALASAPACAFAQGYSWPRPPAPRPDVRNILVPLLPAFFPGANTGRGEALLRPCHSCLNFNSAASTRPRPHTRRRSHRQASSPARRPSPPKNSRQLQRPPRQPALPHPPPGSSCTAPRRSCAANARRFPSPTAAAPRRLR